MTLPLHQEDQWRELIAKYNRLLAESQMLAGVDELKSLQKYLAAQELAQIIDKLN